MSETPAAGGASTASGWSPRLLALAGRKPVQIAAALAGVLYFAYYVSRFHLAAVWPLAPRGDAQILYAVSDQVFARGGYDPSQIFPYSPSAVLMFVALGAGGAAAFALAWLGLMAAGLGVSVGGGLVQEARPMRAAWPLLALIAVILADSPIGWDLRNANSNLVYLGLTMAGYGLLGRRPFLAGVLVGLSISLKLYSGLLLVWMLVNGPRKAFAGGLATVIFLWAALPAAAFGLAGAEHLYAGWQDQVRRIAAPATQTALAASGAGAPVVTLQKAIVRLTGGAFGSAQTLAWLHALWAGWIAILLWYAWRWLKGFPAAAPSRAALADWVVILLTPLPVSPWLEPYHAIPILVGALLLAIVALDATPPRAQRVVAAAGLAVLAVIEMAGVPFAVRGFSLLAQFATLVLALAWLRPTLAGARLSAAGPKIQPVH